MCIFLSMLTFQNTYKKGLWILKNVKLMKLRNEMHNLKVLLCYTLISLGFIIYMCLYLWGRQTDRQHQRPRQRTMNVFNPRHVCVEAIQFCAVDFLLQTLYGFQDWNQDTVLQTLDDKHLSIELSCQPHIFSNMY